MNHTVEFGAEIDWHAVELNHGTRLWKLNLHYHEFLIDVAHYYVESNDIMYLNYLVNTIKHWINENPIGTRGYGQDNWNSYALSLRIVAWIKIYRLLASDFDEDFKQQFLISLLSQTNFMTDNLELDILGNHLIKNYKALKFTADFFNEPAFSQTAQKIYDKYIRSQITADGIHEELSPMYTGIVLEDLGEVYYLNVESSNLKEVLTKGLRSLSCLTYEGDYSFFNDSVNQNEVSYTQLKKFLESMLGEQATHKGVFNVDGYVGSIDEAQHLIVDFAPVIFGPQPGHVHCDAGSLEWFVEGSKILTNSGVYEYNDGWRRDYARSTKAHNTLSVSDREQSEIWGAFRLGRSARVKLNEVSTNLTEGFNCSGEVSYFNAGPAIKHQRSVSQQQNTLTVVDRLLTPDASAKAGAKVYFHFHSLFKLEEQGKKTVTMVNQNGQKVCLNTTAQLSVETTEYFPEFGIAEKKLTVVISNFNDGTVTTEVKINGN
ncbi:alginate lyase family protein [Oceaniserpentilla sp. 4NH20-0058]|uniref:alginate lyase family protein n=1 Tax=Oceaniserpentilla sp. 4NH20-0058 TaxID=3127660 RepID=UPI003340C107